MATVAVGQTASVYVPLSSSITLTPGAGGKMSVNGRNADGSAVVPHEIYSATTIDVQAGAWLSIEAAGADGVYTEPALSTSQVEALVAAMPGGSVPSLALSSVGEAVRSGWRMSAPVMQTPSAYVPQNSLVAYLRAIWEYNRALLNPFNNYQANVGTVVYVDPQAATNGAGTLASPRNILPGFADNQTILLKEGSVFQGPLSMGARANWLLGTYDARTGGRVFDPTRLATVDGAGATAVNMSGAQTNTWISGIKVRNYATGIAKGRHASASGGGVEFCVDGGGGTAGGRFVQNFVRGAKVRFNVCHVSEVDGIWHGECLNTSGDTEIYGNDVAVPAGSADGPDCLQLNFLASEACGAVTVHTNWFDNSRSNRKQIIIASYAGPKQVGDSLEIYRCICVGADTSLPTTGGSLQNGIYSQVPGTDIHENVVVNSRYPIIVQSATLTITDGARVVGNLIIVDMAGKMSAAIEATGSVAGPAMVIEKNTIAGLRCGGLDTGAGMPPAIKSYAAATIRSNVVLGAFWDTGIRVKAADAGGALTTTHNAFDSRMANLYFDNGAGARATNAADWSGAENWVDAWWRPLLGSPLETEGDAWPGGAVADVYGHAAIASVDAIGALHPARVAA